MQASEYLWSLGGDEDVANSQKSAQSKGFWSLLASVSTGMRSTSLPGFKAGHQTCNTSSGCKSDDVNSASAGYVVSMDGDCSTNYSCVTDSYTDLRSKNRFRCRSGYHVNDVPCRQNTALWCFFTLVFCLCTMVLGVHFHYQMRDQNQMMQNVVKDYHSLRETYQALRDDHQRLREEFDNYRDQKEVITKTYKEINTQDANDGDAVQSTDAIKNGRAPTKSGDQRMESSDDLLQLLRPNGLPEAGSNIIPRRTKRSEADRQYIESIVINYLRQMPMVHLKGINNTSASVYRDHPNTYLVWQPDPESPVRRRVTLKHVHHQLNRVKGIEIQQTGIYLVYSQVIVNGTNGTVGLRRDCAHKTVMLPHHDDHDVRPRSPKVLLSGFLTQDAEGYYRNDNIPFPRDSSLQMGIFRLFRQSEIRVQLPEGDDCRRTLFANDLHSSYFGLFRIA